MPVSAELELGPDTRPLPGGKPPLVAHVIYHLGVGGLENGLVNLINHMPAQRYRHAIICMKGSSDFAQRITRKDVEIVALNKKDGKDPGAYFRMYQALRRLNPDLVHTRNLGTMEMQAVAALAGVRARAHGEHGRDIFDLDGKNRKYLILRKALLPFVGHFTTVSKDLEGWLTEIVGAAPDKVTQIYNGVDSERFRPRTARTLLGPAGFMNDDSVVIGSVGRMAAVKDYPNLVRAFLMLLERQPECRSRVRLLIAGDGESRATCLEMLRAANAESLAWLPGERNDIAELMRVMDVFVLPSLGEGISNTILEAMSTGLPVVATRVGGNLELIDDCGTGKLVPPADPTGLAASLYHYCNDAEMRIRHGSAARRRIEAGFSMDSMAKAYMNVYDGLLRKQRVAATL